ncbi:hypothetical protein LDENG_00103680 [Lucifuga dentata]|nr:hypothetical protein LDENG_00103680 [Lucifuga dentata]
MNGAYQDLPLHGPVGWLNDGKVLERFVECIDVIRAILAEKQLNYPDLTDETWLVKLMFLTDITGHLNTFNLQLQGAGQTVLPCLMCGRHLWQKSKFFHMASNQEPFITSAT